MKTKLLILGVLIALAVGGISQATDPVGQAEKPPAPTVGKVLILENDRILEGDIEHVADQYRVKRSTGETWVTAGRVLSLCASYDDAYLFVRGRANLSDPDERLRLAQWCRQCGLRERALEEVKAAVVLRPEHAETRRLLNGLLQAEESTPSTRPTKIVAEPVVLQIQDVGSESVNQFITRVQPILMNTCISCHATGQGGNFHLQRCYQVGSVNRKTMQQNLAAVITQLDLARPAMSPLLIKAVSTHSDSMAKAPIKDRQAGAYKILVDWVEMTARTNPQLLQAKSNETTTAPAISGAFASSALSRPTDLKTPIEKPLPAEPQPLPLPTPFAGVTSVPTSTPPATTPMPDSNKPVQKTDDVVDPGPFNQQNHPTSPTRKPQG